MSAGPSGHPSVSREIDLDEVGRQRLRPDDDGPPVRRLERDGVAGAGFDHRIIDGSDAGKFMSDFKSYLENWSEDIA